MALILATPLVLAETVDALPSWQEFKQVRDAGRSVWQLTIDNDSLLLKKDDGFYTSGNKIAQTFVHNTDLQSVSYGWYLGQDLYTASDINLLPSQIAANDHPYAGWIYGGVFRETMKASGQSLRFGLELGCLGPCAAGEWSQTHLHRLLHQPLPQGWSTQLKNEWGAVLSAEVSPGRLLPMSGVDLTPKLKARLGNIFTDASAELTLRAGHLNVLPEQSASYGFARVELKAVAYNATLQGGYFNDEHTGISPKTAVGEIELGYLWRDGKYGLGASVLRRSNEIKELSNGTGAQNFARVQIFYAM
ncbi:MAG: lipid A deacylase LpxR family protein [Burkholderiales bacterium]|nr:lipid A deacylase LpxR family protein [Burkholderiales bacterium]